MNSSYDLKPYTNNIDHTQNLTFICQFKPHIEPILEALHAKEKQKREDALKTFHAYFSQNIKTISGLNIWISGTVPNYKLADIRALVQELDVTIVTRESKKVELLVVGEKTKVKQIPSHLTSISSIAFKEILHTLKEAPLNHTESQNNDAKKIEQLLSNDETVQKKVFDELEKEGISLKVLPLILAIYKVHKEKKIRTQAKELLLKQKNKTAKEVMLFCESRNYLNAKYSVGMEELAKITKFDIELFLYYLVLEQKNHLGKEYLASLDSDWTQKLIEEHTLLNQQNLTLYGKAGKRFAFAKNITSFTVYAASETLWEMDWLESLSIVESKTNIILPKELNFKQLQKLKLETKELTLQGKLSIKELSIAKCKVLRIQENFIINQVENIVLESCSFNLDVLKDFLKRNPMEHLKSIKIDKFPNYKIPKDLKKQIYEINPNIELRLN